MGHRPNYRECTGNKPTPSDRLTSRIVLCSKRNSFQSRMLQMQCYIYQASYNKTEKEYSSTPRIQHILDCCFCVQSLPLFNRFRPPSSLLTTLYVPYAVFFQTLYTPINELVVPANPMNPSSKLAKPSVVVGEAKSQRSDVSCSIVVFHCLWSC
jgi:hypothetical protein